MPGPGKAHDVPSPFVRREPAAPHPPETDLPARRVWMLTRDASRAVDRVSIDEFGVPSIVLMENAARSIARECRRVLKRAGGRSVVVFCGPGNNGGDGLATARHLRNRGATVACVLSAAEDRLTPDARTNLAIARRMGIPISNTLEPDSGRADLVVDALFGTGLTRAPTGDAAAAIETINSLGARGTPVLAVDLPSGLDADTGERPGACVRAGVTVALAGLKPGLVALAAHEWVGEVRVGDIGCPVEVLERLGTPVQPPPGSDP